MLDGPGTPALERLIKTAKAASAVVDGGVVGTPGKENVNAGAEEVKKTTPRIKLVGGGVKKV